MPVIRSMVQQGGLRRLPRRILVPRASVVLVTGGFVAGYALVAAGAGFGGLGPLVVLAIPILPALTLAVAANPRVGLAAVVASFPLGTVSVPLIPLQLVQLVVVLVAPLVALPRLSARRGPLPFTATMAWGVALCAWLVIALPSALDHRLAMREVVLYVVGFATAAVVVAACRDTGDVANALRLVLVAAAAVSAMTPFNLGEVRVEYGGAVVAGRATGIFTQPNQLGTFAAAGCLIGIGLTIAGRSARERALLAMATGTCLVGLLLSLSRGAWIGFGIGIIVLLAKVPQTRAALLLATPPLFLIALLLGSFAPTSPESQVVGQRLRSIAGQQNPYDSRPVIWDEAIREIRADPLTGQGPGNFPVASTSERAASRTVFADHAHNQVLTWAAENGLPAAGLAVALGVALHSRLRRVARVLAGPTRATVAGLAAALAAVAGQGMVDYTLRNTVVATTVFLLLGCAFAYDDIVLPRRGA